MDRVQALEKRMERVEDKLDALGNRLSKMEGEISRLPGYPGLFVICASLVGVVGLLVRFL
ncbi:hypothetical protein CN97_00890 [Haematobacter massiliensis]|uniref:Uncharacterized protein n=1 Tax=Haematobacter massiliensis TaxID=195105 RepID=A0A086Y0J7_9RHOB|nr:hypothetical protein [Haematobacter massiliensis]KFI27797.1 hypothetical protein CN97_00890 [Haematobacter massiliensis]OWJ82739.1 hypothetical protein CDV51_17170 [Haematobacter massiliensis]